MLLFAGCADDTLTVKQEGGSEAAFSPIGQPVMFSSGSMEKAGTRSDAPLGSTEPYYHDISSTKSVPYLAQNGRFVCTMYYHATAGATDSSPFDVRPNSEGGTMATAWLKVNNTVGNSVYWNKAYTDVATGNLDSYGFDKDAAKFYWQNRLTHAFLALADYNKLTSNDGTTTAQGKLKMFPWGDKVLSKEDVPATDEKEAYTLYTYDPTINVYDLTRGDSIFEMVDDGKGGKEKEFKRMTVNTITDQPDPIRALTIMKPEGATQEANRVRLYFKHQFSQIQVNIKGPADESATIEAGQIQQVELLGVSTEGYVNNVINADGTIGNMLNSEEKTVSALGKEVNLDEFDDDELAANKWGTSFQMFDMGEENYASGYLKSFNAIAFGKLWGIRVKWKEKANDIYHVATFEVPLTNEVGKSDDSDTDKKPVVYLRNLQSGMKYIYNLELRRGTLAVIRTQIIPWDQKAELVYNTDGTISN